MPACLLAAFLAFGPSGDSPEALKKLLTGEWRTTSTFGTCAKGVPPTTALSYHMSLKAADAVGTVVGVSCIDDHESVKEDGSTFTIPKHCRTVIGIVDPWDGEVYLEQMGGKADSDDRHLGDADSDHDWTGHFDRATGKMRILKKTGKTNLVVIKTYWEKVSDEIAHDIPSLATIGYNTPADPSWPGANFF